VGQSELSLGPRVHLAQFIDELFPDTPEDFTGRLTFETKGEGQPLVALTLGQSSHGAERASSTLPAVDPA